MRTRAAAILVVGAFLLGTTPSMATPVTFYFEGVVDIAQGPLLGELLGPGVVAADLLGTTFHGSYTFDSATPDANGSAAIGTYAHSGSPYGMEFHFDHRSFFYDAFGVAVYDNFDVTGPDGVVDDGYAVQTTPVPHLTDPNLSHRGRLDMFVSDPLGPNVLTSDALLLEPPDLLAFDNPRVFVNMLRLEDDGTGGTVSLVRAGLGGSLRVLRVPEPSSLAILGLGLFGLIGARRRARA